MASRTSLSVLLAFSASCLVLENAAASDGATQLGGAKSSLVSEDSDANALSILEGVVSRRLSDSEKADTHGQRVFMGRFPGGQRFWIIPKPD